MFKRELLFQLILHIVVFIFFAFNWFDQAFLVDRAWFFLMYALATIFVSYYLMPTLLYTKKYLWFFVSICLVLAVLILLEEKILEPLLYPNTKRANTFPGLFYTLFGILPVMTILTSGKFAWDAIQQQDKIKELQSTITESELQFLRSQVNPHFLFNNLNNLYSYALEGSSKTPEIILEMSGVLRYMLYESKERFVPLNKELEQLTNFIKLYKLQIEERGEVSFTVGNGMTGQKIAPLILIVFIENAFKHSQSGQSSNIKIAIDVNLKGSTLFFSCVNNFETVKGLDSVASGIGLANVKKRLQLLYPNKHILRITEQHKEFRVDLQIELETD
ncbi:histidine kinase [Croceivirga radicis]|uniref:Histidine kinase n=1 Tax=Croceivirga radicis TaxID=1929488 RepID=A0A1V6LNA4_9FLAO|nr:histidine kinase [Croceivirga radicis]OQD41618.1 histidine kinase [Croceivirga radicis]